MKVSFSFAGLLERLSAFKDVTLRLCGSHKKDGQTGPIITTGDADTFTPDGAAGSGEPGIRIQFNKNQDQQGVVLPAPESSPADSLARPSQTRLAVEPSQPASAHLAS